MPVIGCLEVGGRAVPVLHLALQRCDVQRNIQQVLLLGPGWCCSMQRYGLCRPLKFSVFI